MDFETAPEGPRWASLEQLQSESHLETARGLVHDLEAACDDSARYRAEVLEFIDSHPDALHRTCVTGHLTGSAWVVDSTGEHGLVLFHSKIQRWLQPGGHADGEANLARVALLEASEESGIEGLRVWTQPVDVDIHLLDASASEAGCLARADSRIELSLEPGVYHFALDTYVDGGGVALGGDYTFVVLACEPGDPDCQASP